MSVTSEFLLVRVPADPLYPVNIVSRTYHVRLGKERMESLSTAVDNQSL